MMTSQLYLHRQQPIAHHRPTLVSKVNPKRATAQDMHSSKAPHQQRRQKSQLGRLAVGKTCPRMKTQASRMRLRGAQTLRAYRNRQ